MSEIEINKYQNGKIYKILNTETDDIYVGSTCMELQDRMKRHITAQPSKQGRKLYNLMNTFGHDVFYIELVELFPCETKEDLRKQEGHHIRLIGNLNMCIAGRTRHEYRNENKEYISEQSKEYRARTQEHQTERQKQDKVKAWKNTKVECPCGGSYTNCHKAEHLKSMRHLEYEDLTANPELADVKAAEAALKDKERMESRKIQQKEYRTRNKEEISKQKKEYYEDNKDVINTYKKEWYEKNQEAVIARVKANNEANRDQKLEYYKKRYEDKKESLSIKVDCPCGGCYSVMSKNKHMRTAKHKKYEEELKE